MKIEDLKNSKELIINTYKQLGGLDSMLKEFLTTLLQAIEFGLSNSEDVNELVLQFFNDRYKGIEPKKGIRDVVTGYKERNNLD